MKVAAIGTFDGVHTGHRSVLETLSDYASVHGLQPVAITFSFHPLSVIAPERTPSELTPLREKEILLREAGVTPLVLDFDEKLRNTTAAQWMKTMKEELDVIALVIGYDNTFGKDGVNLSLEDYKKLGAEFGIDVITAPEVKNVSSSVIRKAVVAGDVEKTMEKLGRPYSITAKVHSGNHVGHKLGFPTANITCPPRQAMPKPGVYAAIVKLIKDGSEHPAMVNVGTRPTLRQGDGMVIEAHLINWEGDLYDKEITVKFLKRLRDEQRFNSIEELKRRLSQDRLETLALFADKI